MIVESTLLETVQALSIPDKLALIETISQMLQDELRNKTQANGIAKQIPSTSEPSLVRPMAQDLQALIHEALLRPIPNPDKMLRLGMFQGRIPTEEDRFKAAEWHPTDEEIAGA